MDIRMTPIRPHNHSRRWTRDCVEDSGKPIILPDCYATTPGDFDDMVLVRLCIRDRQRGCVGFLFRTATDAAGAQDRVAGVFVGDLAFSVLCSAICAGSAVSGLRGVGHFALEGV